MPGAEPGNLRALPSSPSPGPAHDAPTRSRLVPALAAVLVLVGALLVWQSLRAEALGERVDALTGELAAAEEEIQRHEQRWSLVRTHVDDLSARISTLRELIAAE